MEEMVCCEDACFACSCVVFLCVLKGIAHYYIIM